MELFRLHAYAITPTGGAEDAYTPDGGAVVVNKELRKAIDESLTSAAFDSRTRVDFDVDSTTRTNDVRDLIIEYAFGQSASARAAALELARRLSKAMDLRSAPCLFIPVAFREDDGRIVTLWTFPREEAFRLRQRRAGPAIQILTDIFSKTSHLRKAAQFAGRNLRNHFLSGRVLDFQASGDIADFWISRFLQCRFAMAGDAGTRLLARTVRKAYDECKTPSDQEELFTAVMAIRRSPHKRLSLQDFSDRYLTRDGEAHNAFLNAIPNSESLSSVFDFKTEVFDRHLHFRIFQLRTGVFVSSPLPEIGRSVRVIGENGRYLSCEGTVIDERLRNRHA